MPLSLTKLIHDLQNGQMSSVELTQQCLDTIDKKKALNAFISVDPEYTLRQAAKADIQLRAGNAPLLTGIPLAHKDVFCSAHFPTTCGSKMLENFYPPYQATVVNKLEAAGGIVLGKTNMDEFSMGSANETSFFGPVKNPWDGQRVAGGSSGGSAAAVSAGLAVFATGSDTGGSIRQPAAFCGISGIKPTYGLLSRYGMTAYASSLDQAGALAGSAEDLAIILQVMAGHDPLDSTSLRQPVPHYTQSLNASLKGLKIGLPGFIKDHSVAPSIQKALQDAIDIFEKAGAETFELDFTLQNSWIPCYYIIACAEASSNLSRFDGLRFGHRSQRNASLEELVTASRTEGFGEEVKKRILTGTYALSSGYFDDYYLKALKVRRLIQKEWLEHFRGVDLILGPVSPTSAFPAGFTGHSKAETRLADMFTVPANLAGLPAISIPAGFEEHLPLGIQLTAPPFQEARLLNAAHQFQQETYWHLKQPEENAS